MGLVPVLKGGRGGFAGGMMGLGDMFAAGRGRFGGMAEGLTSSRLRKAEDVVVSSQISVLRME